MSTAREDLGKALNAASTRIGSGVEWIGFRRMRESTTLRYARDGKPEKNETSVSSGVMVEALVEGQFGYSAAPTTDPERLLAAVDRAIGQARQAAPFAIHRFNVSERPQIRARHSSPYVQALPSVSAGEINALLVEICRELKHSPRIIRTGAFVQTVETEIDFLSTNGSDGSQTFQLITSDFEATASSEDGSVVQKRSDGGLRGRSYQGGWEFLKTPDLWERVERVAEQALELVAAEECPTESTSLVVMPDQMMLQIHESIGHPLELDRILGDERNFAGWSFVNPTDFGSLRYGSPIMNVTFDPTVPHEFASYAFDDTGAPARREHLIRDGILVRGLGGLESQARLGIPGVANARASSWNRPAIDRMANINLEPGSSSLEEIIASVESGVLMESNRSWSIDDFRNKFQFGCEYAKRIERGKVTRTLRNPNYRGVTLPFWRSLKAVGNAATRGVYGTPYCGKGEPSQLIRVGHASPVCLFENVEVFGGA